MNAYADSSLITSLYVIDAHQPEALRRMNRRPAVWLTQFNRTEVAHAISQYVFRGKITPIEAERVWTDFQKDCAQGIWIPINLPEKVWDTSIGLAQRYGPTLGVRTLDSLHVACALELHAQKFWTFDDRQARLAEAAGLDTAP